MKQNLQDQAYAVLRERIATGSYGPGDFLSENSLSAELRIGRTPIRAAIDRLQAEGVLERRRRVGTFVRHIEPAELRELFDIRAQLEPLAVRQAVHEIRAEELACLEALAACMSEVYQAMCEKGEAELLDRQRIGRLVAADMAFHEVLVWAGGNRWIHRILDGMQVFARFFGVHRHPYDREAVQIIAESHGAIVEALRRGDGEAAAREVQHQLGYGRKAAGLDCVPVPRVGRAPVPMRLPAAYLEHLSDIPELQTVRQCRTPDTR